MDVDIWLLSLSIIFLSFSHVVACISSLFLLLLRTVFRPMIFYLLPKSTIIRSTTLMHKFPLTPWPQNRPINCIPDCTHQPSTISPNRAIDPQTSSLNYPTRSSSSLPNLPTHLTLPSHCPLTPKNIPKLPFQWYPTLIPNYSPTVIKLTSQISLPRAPNSTSKYPLTTLPWSHSYSPTLYLQATLQ